MSSILKKEVKIVSKALEYYGIKEILGGSVNKKVLGFLNDVSSKKHEKNIPWCAAFVGSMLKKCGFKYSSKLTARDYLKVGKSVDNPAMGDIVIFWRDSLESWKGHVGIFIAESEHVVYVLGGNQDNTVCIKPYPRNRVIGYQRPIKKSSSAVPKKSK